jgi:hypothetical protein
MSATPAGDIAATLLPAGAEPVVLAVIWATVDADRVLAGIGLPGIELADDPLLGASVRLVRPSDGDPIALVEPRTEGLLAETLARSGEGPAGRYVLAADGLASVLVRAAAAGVALTRAEPGPFGQSVLVRGGPTAGPHLVLVERSTGTIDS